MKIRLPSILAAAFVVFFGLAGDLGAVLPQDYDKALDGLIESMGKTLINLSHEHKTLMGVALFREQYSGQRSAFCGRLENDLAKKVRDDTIFSVPGSPGTQAALKELSGFATDPGLTQTAAALGGLMKVDCLLWGTYGAKGNAVVIRAHLSECADGTEIWKGEAVLAAAEIRPLEGDLMPETRPATYAALEAPDQDPACFETLAAPPSPQTAEHDARESKEAPAPPTSDLARGSLALGYKRFLPKDPTFSNVTGPIDGGFAKASWADLLNAQFEMWSASGVKLSDINGLWAYGFRASATLPLRLGPYFKIYGGLGGKTESIVVNPKFLASQYGVSYGNNSFYGTLGVKAHQGPWGLDFEFTQDFDANYTNYSGIQAGLYYEIGGN